MRHTLERTSPKGEDFIGYCLICGKRDISSAAFFSEECPNLEGVTQDEAVLRAIEGDNR